jgi:DNA-binding PadR family transcriptional regulator
MLYPVLHRLERQRLVESYWEEEGGRRRKYYRLRKEGREALREQRQQWNVVHHTLASLWG